MIEPFQPMANEPLFRCDSCGRFHRSELGQKNCCIQKWPDLPTQADLIKAVEANKGQSNLQKYPKYFRDVADLKEIDVYGVCRLFGVSDASGALHHAIKKLLLSGVRTGGKSARKDIEEARDTLNRYLEIHK